MAQNPAPYGRNRDGTPSTKEGRANWNRLRAETGLGGEQLYQYLTRPKQVDPMEQFMAMMGGFEGVDSPSGSSDAEIATREQDNLRTQRYSEIDQLWGDRTSAAARAATDVNAEIKREQENAALRGVDFSITDGEKSTRVSNAFGTLWGEGDESSLSGLVKLWGNPEQDEATRMGIESGDVSYDWTYDVIRGVDGAAADAAATKDTETGTKVPSTTTALTQEDPLGGKLTALGA